MLYRPISKWEWAFTFIGAGEAVVSLILHSVALGYLTSLDNALDFSPPVSNTLALVKLNAIMVLSIFGCSPMIVYDALESQNVPYIAAITVLSIPILALTSLQYQQVRYIGSIVHQTGERTEMNHNIVTARSSLLADVCICTISACLKVPVAYKLYNEFEWATYKHISADLRMKARYQWFQLLKVAMTFNVLFTTIFLTQMYWFVRKSTDHSQGQVYIVFLSLSIFVPYMIFKFVKHELPWGPLIAALWYPACIGIFSWSIFIIQASAKGSNLSSADIYLISISALSILSCLLTMSLLFKCALSFGKGLAPYIL